MTKRVLIIGAYGNFGSHITKKLAAEPDIRVIVAGRSEEKCRMMADKYKTEYYVLDIEKDFPSSLQKIKPDIVIHTSGPFQGQGYDVAEACIHYGCHYIDLADGREFVANVGQLDQKAKEKGVSVITGASSVPCLTSAIIDRYMPEFRKLTAVDYGITTAQRTNTGLATTKAVLGYAGKPFKTRIGGRTQNIYGWQGTVLRKYPELGYRFLGNCDVPDLELFPQRYKDLDTIRFRAGLEIPVIHLSLWAMTWLVRLHLIKSLEPLAAALLKSSRLFDWIGSDNSAFHMEMTGVGKDDQPRTVIFYLIARSGHGPFIPSIPSIVCAKMLARGELVKAGAFPCTGVISLDQYLGAMKDLNIKSLVK